MYVRKLFDSFFLYRCSSNITMNDSLLLLCNNIINSNRRSMSQNKPGIFNEWMDGG